MITVNMHLSKETKGTFVYADSKEYTDSSVPSIYIRKTAFPDGAPQAIKLSIEPVDKK